MRVQGAGCGVRVAGCEIMKGQRDAREADSNSGERGRGAE